MIYLTISVLVGVILLLCWLVAEQGKSIRHLEDVAQVDRRDARASYMNALHDRQMEYIALVESYARQEGKVYVTPVTRYSEERQPLHPDPPTHAFRMKPPPPIKVGSPSIGTAPAPASPDRK